MLLVAGVAARTARKQLRWRGARRASEGGSPDFFGALRQAFGIRLEPKTFEEAMKEVQRLRAELDDAKKAKDAAELKQRDAEERLNQSRLSEELTAGALSAAEQRVATSVADVEKRLRAEMQSVKEDRDAQAASARRYEEEATAAYRQRDLLRSERDSLKEEQDALTKKLKASEEVYARLRQELVDERREMAAERQQLRDVNAAYADSTSRLQALEAELSKTQAELAASQKEAKAAEDKLAKMMKKPWWQGGGVYKVQTDGPKE